MYSIRARLAIFNAIAVAISITAATIISTITVANFGHESAERTLSLQCEAGKNSLNYYFKSVEQSVNIISGLINDDLDNMSEDDYSNHFSNHMDDAKRMFGEAANHTNGVLTYYYRIDPSITAATNEKGFWFIDLDGNGFQEHEVTDLSDDRYECIWFYTPKETGNPIWLSPYVTDNLDVYVVSYNVPVYRNNTFVGVVGIEIGYETLGEQIDHIQIFNTGFAFIIENDNGTIIYHPTVDILKMPEAERPVPPSEFVRAFKNKEHHVTYTFQGVEKHSYWLELSNNMSIVVAVPQSEVNSTWQSLITRIVLMSIGIITLFAGLTVLYTQFITKPLKKLTLAAEEINRGNYSVKLTYNGNDEIGVLTNTFNSLIKNLDEYIGDLNSLAYSDALTNVGNKGSFNVAIADIQKRIEDPMDNIEFAVAIFDCDNLKEINDAFGHDRGDIYIRNTSNLIMRVFQNSNIYRLGGDEFAVILLDSDFRNKEELHKHFLERMAEICSFAKEPWEKISVSIGIATYDPDVDNTAHEVVIHADHLMYNDKRNKKKNRA